MLMLHRAQPMHMHCLPWRCKDMFSFVSLPRVVVNVNNFLGITRNLIGLKGLRMTYDCEYSLGFHRDG